MKAKKGMKTWFKITLWIGALTIIGFAIAPIVMNVHKKSKQNTDTGFMKGMIDSVWMEMPRHDVRLRSPGVWEEAWLDTMYFMRLQDPATYQFRTVELYNAEVYRKFKDRWGEYIRLESDSVKVAENEKKWIEDSIKYAPAIKEMRERAAKRKNF